jgi:3-hydroxybutyryl-CoA dehydrogenase
MEKSKKVMWFALLVSAVGFLGALAYLSGHKKVFMRVQTVSVLGSGTMGVDIALMFAQKGYSVLLWHRSCAKTAQERLQSRLDRYAAKEIISKDESVALGDKILATDSDEYAATADLVVETISEECEPKVELLTRFDRLMPVESLLVTNTSSFSVKQLGQKLIEESRFAGLHFFNPAMKMELVEIVASTRTSSETIDTLHRLTKHLGKTAVTVKDTPGFIVNRLLMIQINSAIHLLESGAASAHDIDRAMTIGLGHKLGPLALADFIGLDVVNNIMIAIYKRTGELSYKPGELLMRLVKQGKLGRKTNMGFYFYK